MFKNIGSGRKSLLLGSAVVVSLLAVPVILGSFTKVSLAAGEMSPIQHDADYHILEHQHSTQWAADDKTVDEKLAAFKKKNGGKPPNILYVLLDDVGFGELGNPTLNQVRGIETPRMNDFAAESMRFARMYTEPSCTPTRVAMMTGRQPYRNGMGNTSVAISGFGLAAEEVTLAEMLSEVGYNTVHIGKWHMGDIREAWPTEQGFDFAAFPIHQQAQLAIFHNDGAAEEISIGVGAKEYNDKFTLDRTLRPSSSAMVAGVEGRRGETVREVDMKAGDEWTQAKYNEMNQRYRDQTLEYLAKLAAEDEPFFLQYWPLEPLTFTRADVGQFTTPNGGVQAEALQNFDAAFGKIVDELDRLGIAEETLVVFMGDNGNFTKYQTESGLSPMIYRGGKGDATEGGVRVDAFARWPGVIDGGSIVGDIIHVTDLFTTFARIAGADQYIPRDRVIDGVDQTALMLMGEQKGRRDSVFIYQIDDLAAVVKEQYKLHVPPGGSNFIVADFYDLFRDPREEKPVSTQVGGWASAGFVSLIQRHVALKQQFPDKPAARGRPYVGIENLRPESAAAVEDFMFGLPQAPEQVMPAAGDVKEK